MAPPDPPLVHHEHPAPWRPVVATVPRQRTDGDVSPGVAMMYGSFACPWSYLASQRTAGITDPARRPTWRMIDTDGPPGTRLSAPGGRLDPSGTDKRQPSWRRCARSCSPASTCPPGHLGFVPHTGPAVVGYAEAVGAGVGEQVRRLLFRRLLESRARHRSARRLAQDPR